MKTASIAVFLLAASVNTLLAGVNQSCAAGGDPATYIRIHGRLGVYNGGYPNLRIWHIGTHHIYGIFGDRRDLYCAREGSCNEDQDTAVPGNLKIDLLHFWTYGNFELRPLEPFRPGHQQAACIVSADNLIRRRN